MSKPKPLLFRVVELFLTACALAGTLALLLADSTDPPACETDTTDQVAVYAATGTCGSDAVITMHRAPKSCSIDIQNGAPAGLGAGATFPADDATIAHGRWVTGTTSGLRCEASPADDAGAATGGSLHLVCLPPAASEGDFDAAAQLPAPGNASDTRCDEYLTPQ